VRELLINVRKHACVQAAQVSMDCTGNELRITVRDEGTGIDLAATSETSALSSKFGLFSIGERMRAVGGRFELESLPGGGTTATLVTPLHAAPDQRPGVSRQASSVTAEESNDSGSGNASRITPHASPIRVLLVDDHVMVREGLRGLLKDHPDVAVVGEAWDGEEGLAFTDRLRPDVVIMDVNMPKMDGIEATRRIKAAFRSIAVIGLSVNASHQVVEAMVASGADAVLSKEAAGDQIYQTIKALGLRGAQDESAGADGGMEEGP
jgi:CheY-like chemotaxis protein